ncbi:MAG TPA: energy transducer TonB [Opitutaceae bacterium]|nr:energy transducer TonB [Opitutaceae bacterium]
MKRLVYFLVGLAFTVPALADSKEPPVPVRTVSPAYPEAMRRSGVSGVVQVSCLIDERGQVLEPRIERSSEISFEKPALEALKKWKFKPAKQDGAPIAMRVSIPIKFVYSE